MAQQTTTTRPVQHGVNYATSRHLPTEFAGHVFIDCTFDDLDLSFMDMSAAMFINCSFARTNLTGCKLSAVELRDCDMTGTTLTGVSFRDADLLAADLAYVGDISDADFHRARLPHRMYAMNIRTADDTYLSVLLTPSWLAVNAESATINAWKDVIDSHSHETTKIEVHKLLAMADGMGADLDKTVVLREAAA